MTPSTKSILPNDFSKNNDDKTTIKISKELEVKKNYYICFAILQKNQKIIIMKELIIDNLGEIVTFLTTALIAILKRKWDLKRLKQKGGK